MDLKNNIRKYVEWAGGPSHVSREMKLSRTTIWRWYKVGFPDTDFSGRTSHAKALAEMCNKNGFAITQDQILEEGRP